MNFDAWWDWQVRMNDGDFNPDYKQWAKKAYFAGVSESTPVVIRMGPKSESSIDQLKANHAAEIAELKELIVSRFDEDEIPHFRQGHPTHELESAVTAEECRWLVNRLEAHRAALKGAADTISDLTRINSDRAEELAKVTDQRDQLAKALRFYADMNHFKMDLTGKNMQAWRDLLSHGYDAYELTNGRLFVESGTTARNAILNTNMEITDED